MSEELVVRLPDDVASKLDDLDDDRLDSTLADALRDVLDLVDDAETKRDELRERMDLDGRDSEELADLSPVERRQTELRETILEGR